MINRKFFWMILLIIPFFLSCESGLSCEQATDDLQTATDNYTGAVNEGGDGVVECEAIHAALDVILNSSECHDETKSMAMDLLASLNCD